MPLLAAPRFRGKTFSGTELCFTKIRPDQHEGQKRFEFAQTLFEQLSFNYSSVPSLQDYKVSFFSSVWLTRLG